ncbi:MAG: GatB/YqeY domain-containing protein [Clostridiales bacterium]|nr:GatB/YqeY domain-containing protein [Clostridiales bacterium]
MPINEQLMKDLKMAMKEKNLIRKSTIIMLRAAIKQIEVDTRVEQTDLQVVEIIQKQIKQKKAALEEFIKAEREDFIQETESEIEILSEYLPEQMTVEELKDLVEKTISELGATTMKDMGRVMSALKEETTGRADGKTLSTLVKESLNQ